MGRGLLAGDAPHPAPATPVHRSPRRQRSVCSPFSRDGRLAAASAERTPSGPQQLEAVAQWWPIGERLQLRVCGLLKAEAPSPILWAVGDFQSLRAGQRETVRSEAEASGAPSRVPQDAPSTRRTMPYDLLHLGAGDLVARVGPSLLIVTYSLSNDGVAAIGRGLGRLTQRQQKACAISIVERRAGPGTTAEARVAVAELVRKYDTSISGSAVVCDGSGFRATAVRSVVTAINMASRASHPSKVFASCEPAFEWLQGTRPDRDLDVELLGQAAAALRARLKEHVDRAAASTPQP